MTREGRIRSQFDTSGLILEIGPSYNPMLPKADGYRVETVDHTDKQGLIAKYRNEASVDWRKVEDADYVIHHGRLLNSLPHRGHYDTIVGSHVIEHTPDLLAFLEDCDALLKPSGQFSNERLGALGQRMKNNQRILPAA